MADHDNSYKLLFSHAEMVADLLRGFIREDWVRKLDFASLEKVNAGYVSDGMRGRESDVVWRLRWKGSGQWIYVYLLLEFQSTVDPFMAVRVMTYLGLLYQDLIRNRELTPSGKLPRCCRWFCIMEKRPGGPLWTWRIWWKRFQEGLNGTGRASPTVCSTKLGWWIPSWSRSGIWRRRCSGWRRARVPRTSRESFRP